MSRIFWNILLVISILVLLIVTPALGAEPRSLDQAPGCSTGSQDVIEGAVGPVPASLIRIRAVPPEFPQQEGEESYPELDELPGEDGGSTFYGYPPDEELDDPRSSTRDTESRTGDDENSVVGYGDPVPKTGVVTSVGGWLNSFWVLFMFICLYLLFLLISWLLLRLPRPELESGFPFERPLKESPPSPGTKDARYPPPIR